MCRIYLHVDHVISLVDVIWIPVFSSDKDTVNLFYMLIIGRIKNCNFSTMNTWQFNSAKTIFAFSCPPQLRRRAKLFMSCCRP